MNKMKVATGLVQIMVALAATGMATGIVTPQADWLAILVALQNGFGAVDRGNDVVTTNNTPGH